MIRDTVLAFVVTLGALLILVRLLDNTREFLNRRWT